MIKHNSIQNLNKNKFLIISFILYVIFFVIHNLFSHFHRQEVKIGTEFLYTINILLFALICINCMLWILSLRIIKNISSKCHKLIAIVLISVVTLTSAYNISNGMNYIKDIFCEPSETTTNEYMLSLKTNQLFFMEQNKRLGITIKDENINMLDDNKLSSHNISEICSLNGLFYYERPIYIKYYSNSQILIETRIN